MGASLLTHPCMAPKPNQTLHMGLTLVPPDLEGFGWGTEMLTEAVMSRTGTGGFTPGLSPHAPTAPPKSKGRG